MDGQLLRGRSGLGADRRAGLARLPDIRLLPLGGHRHLHGHVPPRGGHTVLRLPVRPLRSALRAGPDVLDKRGTQPRAGDPRDGRQYRGVALSRSLAGERVGARRPDAGRRSARAEPGAQASAAERHRSQPGRDARVALAWPCRDRPDAGQARSRGGLLPVHRVLPSQPRADAADRHRFDRPDRPRPRVRQQYAGRRQVHLPDAGAARDRADGAVPLRTHDVVRVTASSLVPPAAQRGRRRFQLSDDVGGRGSARLRVRVGRSPGRR